MQTLKHIFVAKSVINWNAYSIFLCRKSQLKINKIKDKH